MSKKQKWLEVAKWIISPIVLVVWLVVVIILVIVCLVALAFGKKDFVVEIIDMFFLEYDYGCV